MPRPRKAGRERGSVTIEMVIIFPLLLTVLFGSVQTGLWFHNRSIAMTAAQEGARTAAAYESTSEAGRQSAHDFATAAGGQDPTVTVSRTSTLVRVTVHLESFALLPGLIPLKVEQSATMPLERIS